MVAENALAAIDPSDLTYQEWLDVGMALKAEGLPCSVWDDWSKNDHRYHPGECERKWESFQGSGITAGTLVKMAKDRGWTPPEREDRALDWDDVIELDEDVKIVDLSWLEKAEIKTPSDFEWHPSEEIISYLEALFEEDEYVGYVSESFQRADKKYVPKNKGAYRQTAGELIRRLRKYGDDIGSTFGDYDPNAGAWIRFNPLDGQGVKNENVTDYRFALVESDSIDIETQEAIIRKLELPVAAMVYSGGKSIHAIVRVDAIDAKEYRQRVEYLYGICKENKLDVDSQNKNPSRLSRMPGVWRSGKKQWLMATNIGKSSFEEWKDWIEAQNDNLPDFINLDDVMDDLPDLAPVLIDGTLRQGHKMLLAGPSKAGKSFALIQLAIAIAKGGTWFGKRCTQGRVLYVNLELDRVSCLHRFADVHSRINKGKKGRENLVVWNLRGYSISLEKLVPKLIRRAKDQGFIAVIIDPIYKVIEGDENKAGDMAVFCNQFDKICNELGCAVIYCHHHSKSASGMSAMNRASGSGVFARDPDALLDMVEIELPMDEGFPDGCTGWRVSSVLREFRTPPPFEVFFDYPVHIVTDLLQDAQVKDSGSRERIKKRAQELHDIKMENVDKLIDYVKAYPQTSHTGFPPKIAAAADEFRVTINTIKAWIDASNGILTRDDRTGLIGLVSPY